MSFVLGSNLHIGNPVLASLKFRIILLYYLCVFVYIYADGNRLWLVAVIPALISSVSSLVLLFTV